MSQQSIPLRDSYRNIIDHADVKTTEIYTHVLQQNLCAVVSPLDSL